MIPVTGHKIGTPYGARGRWWSLNQHKGVDFPAPTGTPVHAAVGGRVIGVGRWGTSWGSAFGGHAIVVDCDRFDDGTPGLWCIYAHLSEADVRVGDRIRRGQKIGAVGAEGNVTGPHLHFEVQRGPRWRAWAHVNPRKWLEA